MKILMMAVVSTLLVACNGGNGDGSPAGPLYDSLNHNELAELFVQKLNSDSEFSVTLTKSDTRQTNFIVIYDATYDSYDAINIDAYDPNLDNASEYYNANSARTYIDLDEIPGHYETRITTGWYTDYNGVEQYGEYESTDYVETSYRDRSSGLVFEKVQASAKDLAKVVALKEAVQISKSAEFLSSELGLSMGRGMELASLQAHWKKASKKGMTNAEVDAFSTELLGFSLTSGVTAYKEAAAGDASSLNSLVEQSADMNGITPEHASQLMTKVFGL